MGIQPDILLCRCDRPVPEDAKRKLALFCNLKAENVIEALDVKTIYEVPHAYSEQGLDVRVLEHFGLDSSQLPDMSGWKSITQRIHEPENEVTIAIVAKYFTLRDAYKSVLEALTHGGVANNMKVNVKWVNAEDLEEKVDGELRPKSQKEVAKLIGDVKGILVPGGYGLRGANGKIAAAQFARETNTPYLGICFGMQMAVIETARNVAKLEKAWSTEFAPTPDPIVGLLTEWMRGDEIETRGEDSDMGGTMRLGAYDCHLESDTLAHKVYGEADVISERHRHRYEVNISYREALEKAGMVISGLSRDGRLPVMVERPDHPWFLCMQFHPELKSRPFNPSPVFKAFVEAAHEAKLRNGASNDHAKAC